MWEELTSEISGFGAKLVAVSKTKPESAILELYQKGQRIFGENKVQEMVEKQLSLPKDISWHMIGHLQSNKVKSLVPFVAMIHSVDSLSLLKEINLQAAKVDRIIPCLLQLDIATEATKFGMTEEEITNLLSSVDYNNMRNITIHGLMGMATNTDDKAQIRREFKRLNSFFKDLKEQFFTKKPYFTERSMGMSNDYQIALEEGSTLIRIGSLLFGARAV